MVRYLFPQVNLTSQNFPAVVNGFRQRTKIWDKKTKVKLVF